MQGEIQTSFAPYHVTLERPNIRSKKSFGPDHQQLLEHHGVGLTAGFFCKAKNRKHEKHSINRRDLELKFGKVM